MENVPCQNDGLARFSTHIPRISVLAYRLRWILKERGVACALGQIWGFFTKSILSFLLSKQKIHLQSVASVSGESINLVPGEWVQVKSEREIKQLVDNDWRTRGLEFVPEMREYYGRRLRVMKRVARICVEDAEGHVREVRSLKSTVLLEGALCKGAGIGCDRSCHYFWREVWLSREHQEND